MLAPTLCSSESPRWVPVLQKFGSLIAEDDAGGGVEQGGQPVLCWSMRALTLCTTASRRWVPVFHRVSRS
eukprot:scaffold306562_cov21-Tisochrysis_lutea.AAC.1